MSRSRCAVSGMLRRESRHRHASAVPLDRSAWSNRVPTTACHVSRFELSRKRPVHDTRKAAAVRRRRRRHLAVRLPAAIARPAGRFALIDGITHFLSADRRRAPARARATLRARLGTGWEEKANDYLPHLLGLPGAAALPDFDAQPGGRTRAHWKLDAIDAYAGRRGRSRGSTTRSTTACARGRARARRRRRCSSTTEPAVGMTDEHVARLLAWARRVARTPNA